MSLYSSSHRESQKVNAILFHLTSLYINLLVGMKPTGTALKRKSIQKLEPTLPIPKKQLRQFSPDGRTLYKQLRPPVEQLKQFRKKQLFTIGNLSTQKSDLNINQEDLLMMKQSRFNEDHHNTDSIAQLLSHKMGSNPPTFRTKMSKDSIHNEDDKLTGQKQSMGTNNLLRQKSQTSKGKRQNESQEQGENYDDYVLGEKVDDELQCEKDKIRFKKYTRDQKSTSLIDGYIPNTEVELRMQQRYWASERKRMAQLQQDQEILSIMQQYKNNKQQVINQSRKKHQTARILAAARHLEPKIEKSASLPSLKPKREIIVPEVEESEPDKTKRNMIAKGFQKPQMRNYLEKRLKQSLSSGKLGFGTKKVRTICEQDLYEQEMSSVEIIRARLRSKGINVDNNKLAKGLINHKNLPQYEKQGFPVARLPSNPIYKKFPL